MFEPNVALKTDQDGPKAAPRAAKSGPRATQSGQDRPKTAPRPPKIAQDRPKTDPRPPQDLGRSWGGHAGERSGITRTCD